MADLDVNNVQARAYNNGGLFWKGSGNVYMVPNGGEASSIFAAGIWIGGLDDEGDLRFAGTAYGPFEFWPGPIDEFGNPPADCERYDHIYSVYRSDLEALDRGEPATADIINWPYNLGAPVEDGDGILGNYNLDGGDRPEITGDQMLWWTMNDAGNFKEWSRGRPIGLEVQVSAYAFLDSTAIDNTTFYRYRFRNKGASRLSKSYFGFWVDADLGNAADDFIGSDTTLGLAITYNGRDVDLGDDGYGERPPAVGIDFVQGPIAPDLLSRTWVDPDGTSHPGMWRRQMTTFLYYNGDSSVQGNPTGGTLDPYRYLQGIWRDGTHMTYGGTGYGGRRRTDFMFSGNAAKREYWSEENTDGLGSRNTPADRKFLMSTGPFDLLPGDEQEIVLAIVWSQADSRFGSYAKLLDDDAFVQSMFDRNFEKMPLIEAPLADATTNNESIILSWQNPPSSNNYLERYDERSDAVYDKYKTDLTYSFEGYNVIQYESATDSVGKIIATYDLVNRVQGIAEEQYDDVNDLYVNVVVAQGKDLGVQHYHVVEDVVNYDTYYFGVQAYAYNENSRPKVITSDVSRIEVLPAPAESARGGTSTTAQAGDIIASDRLVGTGSPKGIFATVVAPAAITGNQYRVSILALPDTSALTFQIEDANSDSLLIDGVSVYETSGDIV